MTSVNTGRVILGGLVAGAVINIGDYLINNLLLAEAWQRLAQGHNIDQTVMGGTAAFATFVTIDFLLGVLLVWFYAAHKNLVAEGFRQVVHGSSMTSERMSAHRPNRMNFKHQ